MQRAAADSAAADPIVGRVLEGRYRIFARIARGGMSTVYSAIDERLDRRVAVKVMSGALSADPAFADRFAREARAAAKLSHLNVVAVYDQGSDADHVFLVMELVPGRTLRDLITERGKLSEAEAVSIMEPVLGALAAAHRAGLVHRDIKPENILLSDDGVVKVADFGLARAVDTDPSSTRTGLMMGTVAYCAPEQISRGEADQRSDVYAAGVVLFELLTGAVPYVGENAMSVAYQHVHSRVPAASSRVRGIDESLDDLIIRATDSDPSFRPADAGVMLAELHDIRDELRLPVTAVPPRTRPARRAAASFDMAGASSLDSVATTEYIALGGSGAAGPNATTVAPLDQFLDPADRTRRAALPPNADAAAREGNRDATVSRPSRAKAPLSRAAQVKRRRRRRTLIAFLVLALLGAAAGFGAWWMVAGRYTAIPNVHGAPFDTASAALHQAGFTNVVEKKAFDEIVPKNSVISTSPSAGDRLLPSKPVTVVVSSGQERFTLPDVRKGTEAGARAALAKVVTSDGTAALQVVVTQQSNDSVAKGQVIGTNPPAGTAVKRNDAVTVIVSSGPPIVAIPDVSGKSQGDASAALKTAGFKVATVSAYSDTVAGGVVISQSPAAGQQAVKFSSVTLTVSQGPEYVDVPSVGGQPADSANQTLTGAGFKVVINKVYGGHLGLVVGMDIDKNDQNPNDSGQARVGATITLDVA
ncbi:serine/threonine-protein kinase [Jatrophihabitans sp. GAS493]|uniref:Stk1 family PASTA domain-containing Ser/Thr kinase n=1 Tax=Jatrophihabitans sp. GAS493 TaxID=1907575 RepID=UPI000BB95FEA|nr:Stk1 family PASTA domain-containing Ser/Thr kinase [Jatrophihabitans sp. GAS493]SOD74358.1 serine/threonine-protein kinase [Jatrophihabitans sp. GAS493]